MVLALVAAAVVGAGSWGLGVFGHLSEGGYEDPGSESSRAAEAVAAALGPQGGDVIVVYTPESGTVDDPAVAREVTAVLDSLPTDKVTQVASYWSGEAPELATADRHSGLAVLTLASDSSGDKLSAFHEIKDSLAVPGVESQIGGGAALHDSTSQRSKVDLARAEAISLPVVLILLVIIFGSLVAAALPVLVGGLAVLGSLGVLHLTALNTDVNSFAVNVASLLGLGMAIDYGLFMVGRFREELAAGRPTRAAVRNTVATAGRTVVFSATLLIIALGGLLLFPQGFLRSLSYGGMAAVALAAFISLTLLPALLGILGPRIDKLSLRRRRPAAAPAPATPAGGGWVRLARLTMRRPVLVVLPILAGLLLLAAPIGQVRFGEVDERVLPAGDSARQAIETVKDEFPAMSGNGVQVVLRGDAGAAPTEAEVQAFADEVGTVAGVRSVTPAGAAGDVAVLSATLTGTDPLTDAARATVEGIRALDPPDGTEVLVGGTTARNADSLDATARQLPWMALLLVGATFLLMFLAFGSILLPIKAVLMSALSLSATFGVLVWLFQEGHGAGLLGVTPAPLEVGIIVLMAAVVFGLSTDYEVFLLSRMVEARARGASTRDAVATGLSRTGRVISAAALLLVVVTGAFAFASVAMMRFIGVGMIIALILDATVVRMLLVPATMRLVGDAIWWAPGPLRRLQQRAGLQESDDIEDADGTDDGDGTGAAGEVDAGPVGGARGIGGAAGIGGAGGIDSPDDEPELAGRAS
ncbi:MMPL family transporter [Plantactinospora sp. KBS50]|uniref:MMPL family transporter n=1 Tax=Plantactinospora sp. KBS50 TaxID=2024580 RepID=UPI001E29BA06|nr:MMPL family transporter [Plantactinospora sp. KBS50]